MKHRPHHEDLGHEAHYDTTERRKGYDRGKKGCVGILLLGVVIFLLV